MKKLRAVLGLFLLPWLALSARAADPAPDPAKLPKVLIIGDSISMGYTPVVQKLLQGVAEVTHPAGNCEYTGYGLENMKLWLGKGKWDVIHFNFGIWDTHLLYKGGDMVMKEEGPQPMPGTHLRYSPAQYRENLAKIVALLEKTGAKLIWASTTPVMARTGKRLDDIVNDNVVAAKLMQEHKIPINDLYGLVLPNVKAWQSTDGCHFNPVGYDQIGQQVADTIRVTLTGAKAK